MNGRGGVELFQQMLETRKAKGKELRSQLDEVEKEIQSIQHTLNLYLKERGITQLSPAPLFEHGMSLTKKRGQALVQWAEKNNGILIPKEAKEALIAAGLVKAGKGAAWIVYGTLNNMECWDKIEPGKYRLLHTSPKESLELAKENS